jgi:hypothetical protein
MSLFSYFFKGHHNYLNYESWSSQVKNHTTVKERIDKHVEIYGNKAKKTKHNPTSAFDNLATAAMSLESQPSSPSAPSRLTYTRSTRTALGSTIESLERTARINGWLLNTAPLFPISSNVLAKYVDHLIARVKRGTLGYSRIQGFFLPF